MPCITMIAIHSDVRHAYLRRSQILLTFSQVLYSVFSFVPYVEVAYTGLFYIQQHSKKQV